MLSYIISKLSCLVTFRTSVACSDHDLPNITAKSTSAFIILFRLISSFTLTSFLLVLPKAAILALDSLYFFISLKNSSSLGLDPGHPPSIYSTPSSSKSSAILILSFRVKDIFAPCDQIGRAHV